MTDIEKRAWEKYPEVIKRHNLAHIDINEEARNIYIEAATEQKAIDDANLEKIVSSWKEEEEYWIKRNKALIDKAKEWVNEFCTETNYAKDEIPIIVKSIELFMEE